MSKIRFYFLLVILFMSSCIKDQFVLVDQNKEAVIVIQKNETDFIQKAVLDLVSDIKKITGKEIQVSSNLVGGKPNLIIGTVGKSELISEEFNKLKGKWECYSLKSEGDNLTIAGSNDRGTMFGIYYFIEEYMDVDPFYWWKDMEPKQQEKLVFKTIDYTSKTPDFKFRGWFINDEDLMTEFMDGGGNRDLDYRYYHQVVHPNIMKRVVESAVRLRYNLIIPASFMEIFNPAEKKLLDVASGRGLFLSQHHIEPLGVSAFGYFNYWKRKTGEKPLFSYFSEKEKVIEVWKESAKRWSQYSNVIWQIGLRGIGDRPMWRADPGVPQSDEDRAAIISDAMQTQMDILNELMPGEKHEVTTTLWAEGAVFNEMGLLKFPENTTIIFADNSPGWIMPEDFYKTKREQGINYGIYYHHGLIGSGPHLAQAVPPSKTYEIFSLAVAKKSDYYAIMNVGNVREFVLGIEASRDMLEDMDSFDADEWLNSWCRENFGDNSGEIYHAYQTYFSAYIEDPEIGTPLFLDGLSRSRTRNNLNLIKKVVENNLTFTEKKKGKNGRSDAFSKSLSKAYPGKNLSNEELLNLASKQDSILTAALGLAEKVSQKVDDEAKELLQTNLTAQIKFMQCLTGSVVHTTQALISLKEKDLNGTKEYLKKSLSRFKSYDEALELGSNGKWEKWYRGEKKIDISALRELNEHVLSALL